MHAHILRFFANLRVYMKTMPNLTKKERPRWIKPKSVSAFGRERFSANTNGEPFSIQSKYTGFNPAQSSHTLYTLPTYTPGNK